MSKKKDKDRDKAKPERAASVKPRSAPSGDTAPAAPTPEELHALLAYPVHTTDETRHYRTAPEGFGDVADKTVAAWTEIASQLAMPGLSLQVLTDAIAAREELLPIEAKLEPYYRRAYDNRREADSDGVGMLLKLARTVKGAGDPALTSRFQFLIDWIAAHHAGPKGGGGGGGTGGGTGGGGGA
jgi:hypothetical protein